MSKFNLLLFVFGIGVALFGAYGLLARGDNTNFIFIFGGIVITAIAAGLIGKAHTKDSGDAG